MRLNPSNDESPRLARWRRWTDGPLLVIGIGSVPLVLLDLIRDDLPRGDRIFLWVVTVAVAVAFTIDYCVELALADNRWNFVRSEKISAAIVVSSIISVVPAVGLLAGARLIRLLPAIRAVTGIVRVMAASGLAAREGRRAIRQGTLRVALGLTGLTWVSSAVAFRLAEDVDSFFDALWWAAATITTVGYGDIYPVTAAGRVAGVFAMVVGISSFGILTARLAAFFASDD